MIVYHGTDSHSAKNILENGIDLSFGDDFVDNAKGFYTTPNKAFAAQRARTTTTRKRKFLADKSVKPVVLEIEVDLTADPALSIKRFSNCSFAWREFILYNRLGKEFLRKWNIKSANHNLDFVFDVVMDETADAGVNDIVSKIRYHYNGNFDDIHAAITRIDKSDNLNWDKQISFHSQRALNACIGSMRVLEVFDGIK